MVAMVWDSLGWFGPLLAAPGMFILTNLEFHRVAFSSPEKLARMVAQQEANAPTEKSAGLSRVTLSVIMFFCLYCMLMCIMQVTAPTDPDSWMLLLAFTSFALIFSACVFAWVRKSRYPKK